MSEIPQDSSVAVVAAPLAVALRAEELALLDRFAGLAMQTLLRIGTTEVREHKAHDGSAFDCPDQPFYFGNWEPIANAMGGVDSLAHDAYYVAQSMLNRRRELLANVAQDQ
ncbi:MAG: hypothetical protein GXX96_09960 [Planctomycetaceae bacterium]|nr:hypothetical protein [Planctomycetaceae bacterium]